MSYLDRYKNRVGFWGCTETEEFRNKNVVNFKKFLDSTPHKVYIGEDIVGATIFKRNTDFSEDYYYLLTEIDKPVSVGTIVTDPEGNEWLVATNKNVQTPSYNRYQIISINNVIQWHDRNAALLSSSCLVLGSLKTKLREVFESNAKVLMPQEEGQLLIIMPNCNIPIDTRFILGSRAWKVVGYDDLSTPGIVFLSLEQDKIDLQKDDLDNKIADNAHDEWSIKLNTDSYKKLVGEDFLISYSLYKNQIEVDQPVQFTSNSSSVQINNDVISTVAVGSAEIVVSLVNNKEVFETVTVEVVEEIIEENISFKIIGPDSVKWGETQRYFAQKFVNGEEVSSTFSYSVIDTNSLVKTKTDESYCNITAKLENKIGSIVIKAIFNENPQVIVEKIIYINSLWS